MKTIAFFNSRSGVGKSFLVYHLAFMFQRLGARVVVADIDPQMHLTSAFLDDQKIEELSEAQPRKTILGATEETTRGGVSAWHVEDVEGIGLLAGDGALAAWEGRFSQAWYECLNDDSHKATNALRTTAVFHTVAQHLSRTQQVDVLLLDLAPDLGAINRAALLAADAVLIPVAPDAASRLVLPTVGNALRNWRQEWDARRNSRFATHLILPTGTLPFIGYVVVQHAANTSQDATHWANESALAHAFHKYVVEDSTPKDADPLCLAWLRHLRGLLNLHLEARKPVFDLKAADGAIGTYAMAVKDAYRAFENLAREIAKRAGIALPLDQD